jgi:hypothetical protein
VTVTVDTEKKTKDRWEGEKWPMREKKQWEENKDQWEGEKDQWEGKKDQWEEKKRPMRRRKKTNEKEKKRPMSMHSSMTSRVPKEERKWLRPTIWLLFIGIFEILTHCGRGKWNTAPRILIRTRETSRRTHSKTHQADTISNYLYIQILCKIKGDTFLCIPVLY